MPIIPARDYQAERLASIYRAAFDRLVAEEQRIVADPLQFRRLARLRDLQREVGRQMSGLDVAVRGWLGSGLPAVWAAGAAKIARNEFGWTVLHQQGIAQVASNTYGYLLDATRYINESTKTLIQRITNEQVLQQLTGGETAVQAGRDIAARLVAETGLSAVAYADGSLHGLDEYGSMVARTESALAYNFGAMQQALDDGITLMEVFDGDECGWTDHDDPDLANGKIVTVDEAADNPVAHPNCLRDFAPAADQYVVDENGDPVTDDNGDPMLADESGAPLDTSTDPQAALTTAIASGGPSMSGPTFSEQYAASRHDLRVSAHDAKVR